MPDVFAMTAEWLDERPQLSACLILLDLSSFLQLRDGHAPRACEIIADRRSVCALL